MQNTSPNWQIFRIIKIESSSIAIQCKCISSELFRMFFLFQVCQAQNFWEKNQKTNKLRSLLHRTVTKPSHYYLPKNIFVCKIVWWISPLYVQGCQTFIQFLISVRLFKPVLILSVDYGLTVSWLWSIYPVSWLCSVLSLNFDLSYLPGCLKLNGSPKLLSIVLGFQISMCG